LQNDGVFDQYLLPHGHTVGHLIENFLKKSNAPPMPDPPLCGLTLIGALLSHSIAQE
jgi:hypothetical protein